MGTTGHTHLTRHGQRHDKPCVSENAARQGKNKTDNGVEWRWWLCEVWCWCAMWRGVLLVCGMRYWRVSQNNDRPPAQKKHAFYERTPIAQPRCPTASTTTHPLPKFHWWQGQHSDDKRATDIGTNCGLTQSFFIQSGCDRVSGPAGRLNQFGG